jgi:hypothetical protein
MDRFLPHLTRFAALLFPAILYTVNPAYNHIAMVSRQLTPSEVEPATFRLVAQYHRLPRGGTVRSY